MCDVRTFHLGSAESAPAAIAATWSLLNTNRYTFSFAAGGVPKHRVRHSDNLHLVLNQILCMRCEQVETSVSQKGYLRNCSCRYTLEIVFVVFQQSKVILFREQVNFPLPKCRRLEQVSTANNSGNSEKREWRGRASSTRKYIFQRSSSSSSQLIADAKGSQPDC